MDKKKMYQSAPLPFLGQKRMYVNEFCEILKSFPEDAVYVDLFGGSGLLSHITKHEKPNATVVYNDFDNYRLRLANVDRTNALLSNLREIVKDSPRHKKITHGVREMILSKLEMEEMDGFVDYITLSSSLLFSMNYVQSLDTLRKEAMYNNVRMTDYVCDGYLDGLEIVSCDYKELVAKYHCFNNVVYLVDPPYLSTEVGAYQMYWKLSDYLDVLSILAGTSYIYFTSDKSDILELCQWLGKSHWVGNPFSEARQINMRRSVNYNSFYTDIMLYKVNKKL